MSAGTFQFERALPPATAAEIARFEADGYRVHREWINRIELRKGKPFREWLFAIHVIGLLAFPLLLLPGVVRVAVQCGQQFPWLPVSCSDYARSAGT